MGVEACAVSKRQKRAAAACALAVGALGAASAVAPLQRFGAAEAAPVVLPRLELAAALPAWRAPGAPMTVSGWAGAGQPVSLLANGRRVGHARAGRLGKFVMQVRAPARTRRYRLVLRAGTRVQRLPSLIVRPVVLAAVGDVNLGSATAAAIRAYGADYPWGSAAPLLRAADLAIANLECAVTTRGDPATKEYTFRGDPAALPAVARAGIDVVSLANNHSLDYGLDGFRDTLRHLQREGVSVTGGGRDLAASRRPATVSVGGLRIAVFAYSDVRPAGFDAGLASPGAAPADLTAIRSDIGRAHRRGEKVVVYFHWGTELATTPDSRQHVFARAALEAGATVVLGSHPHVLQPIERRKNRLLAWSLGNFVFAARSPGTTTTGVLTLGLDTHGVRWNELVPAKIAGVRPVLDAMRMRSALARIEASKTQ